MVRYGNHYFLTIRLFFINSEMINHSASGLALYKGVVPMSTYEVCNHPSLSYRLYDSPI